MNRNNIAEQIAARLEQCADDCRRQFERGWFVVDQLLPDRLAREICASFPEPASMMLRTSIRERKYVTSQMNQCAPLLEEPIFAFQQASVIGTIGRITGLADVEADEFLYAGGVSVMAPGHFLNPHLDNSHDLDRRRYRVLNLLYYTSVDWRLEFGGNLEL